MRRVIRRLTLVSDAPHFGGAEGYIVAMAHAARRRGIEPHVYWPRLPRGDADVFGSARESGIRVTSPEPAETRTVCGTVRAFRTMIRRERPDGLVINACGRRRYWLLPWLARLAGVPAVWVHQMVDGSDHRRIPPKWLGSRLEGLQCWRVPQMVRHRLATAASSAAVTLNAEDRERIIRWQGVRREKIRVIPHGVDCERFRFDPTSRRAMRDAWGIGNNPSGEPFVVGTAGRLSHEKGVDLLIEATALVRANGLAVTTMIAGQGVERRTLAELAARRGVANAVKFMTFVDDMPAFYSGLDAFVLCSRTESFGLALAEAMACERAVIGTPTAGAKRQIDHQHNGWQLEGFSPAELADALAALHHDSEMRIRTGGNGRDSVILQFSIDLTLERTLRALRGEARERSFLSWPGMTDGRFLSMATEDLA